eukprot:scaffold52806_cov50-Phaeocystis_antarctica.AAC.1
MGPAAREETGDRGMDSFQRKRQSSRSASRNRLRHQAARGERLSQRAEGGAARPGLDQPVGQWEGGKTACARVWSSPRASRPHTPRSLTSSLVWRSRPEYRQRTRQCLVSHPRRASRPHSPRWLSRELSRTPRPSRPSLSNSSKGCSAPAQVALSSPASPRSPLAQQRRWESPAHPVMVGAPAWVARCARSSGPAVVRGRSGRGADSESSLRACRRPSVASSTRFLPHFFPNLSYFWQPLAGSGENCLTRVLLGQPVGPRREYPAIAARTSCFCGKEPGPADRVAATAAASGWAHGRALDMATRGHVRHEPAHARVRAAGDRGGLRGRALRAHERRRDRRLGSQHSAPHDPDDTGAALRLGTGAGGSPWGTGHAAPCHHTAGRCHTATTLRSHGATPLPLRPCDPDRCPTSCASSRPACPSGSRSSGCASTPSASRRSAASSPPTSSSAGASASQERRACHTRLQPGVRTVAAWGAHTVAAWEVREA